MSDTKRTKNIVFRLTDEEYGQIEKAATASGDDPQSQSKKSLLAATASCASASLSSSAIARPTAHSDFGMSNGPAKPALFVTAIQTEAKQKRRDRPIAPLYQ
jgi:hypothetical protein